MDCSTDLTGKVPSKKVVEGLEGREIYHRTGWNG